MQNKEKTGKSRRKRAMSDIFCRDRPHQAADENMPGIRLMILEAGDLRRVEFLILGRVGAVVGGRL